MTLITQLKTIEDPRGKRGKRYPLWFRLFVALLGSLCGYWGYRPLEKFCQKHHQTFSEWLALDPETAVMPSYSTFRRIFQIVDAQVWVKIFNGWAVLHAPQLAGLLWSIDGKSIKCTSVGGNTSEQNFAALVSVGGQQAGVVQLALMDNRKESEIGVAKRLLEAVTRAPGLAQSLPGGFSLDALQAQVDTLELLESRHCHDLVGLKANQKLLDRQIQRLVQHTGPLSQANHPETLHGRQTQRTVRVYAAPLDFPKRWATAGITRIVWVKRQGSRSGNPSTHEQDYLTNWNLDATTFLQLTRDPWQIENGLHWVKDVTLQEDYPPRRGGFAPMSWAVFNSFLITLARRWGARTIPDCIRDLANPVHQVCRWLT